MYASVQPERRRNIGEQGLTVQNRPTGRCIRARSRLHLEGRTSTGAHKGAGAHGRRSESGKRNFRTIDRL